MDKELRLELRQETKKILKDNAITSIIVSHDIDDASAMSDRVLIIKNGIIAELPEPGTLTFCLGFSSHKGLKRILKENWAKLISSDLTNNSFSTFVKPPFPLLTQLRISCVKAFRSESQLLPLAKSAGHISSELISHYPPGIPLLLPGEALDQERVAWMIKQREFWPDQIPSVIRVVSQ